MGDAVGAVGWMRSVVVGAHDPRRLAEFWCRVLDVRIAEEEPDWVQLTPDPEGNEFCLVQPLPPELARRRWGDLPV